MLLLVLLYHRSVLPIRKIGYKLMVLMVLASFYQNAFSAGPTFVCDGTPYPTFGKNPTTLQQVDKQTLAITNIAPVSPSGTINATGYNILDDYIYGLQGKNFYQLAADGSYIMLGQPTGVGAAAGVAWNIGVTYAGTMDSSGNWYGHDTNYVYRVSIGTNPTSGTLTYERFPRSGAFTGKLADLAFNLLDGNLYGMSGNKLRKITPTGVSSTVVTTGAALSGNAGGAWSTSSGVLYFYNNNGGLLYSVDMAQSTPVVNFVGNVAKNGTFDATACTPPTLSKGVSSQTVAVGETFTYTFKLTNPFTNPLVVDFTDNIPAGFSFINGSLSPATPGSGTVTTFNANTIIINNLTIPAGLSPNNEVVFTAQAISDPNITSTTTIPNQATITYGVNSVSSDDPDSGDLDDPTSVTVYANDWGDAPSSYGDAKHLLPNATYFMGTAPDGDIQAQNTANGGMNGSGDDNNGISDEDGATIPVLTQGSSAETININISQASANEGYLQAWIDWNGDGDFSDIGEQIATDVQSPTAGNSLISLPVSVPSSATTSPTFARFRWSTTSGLDHVTAAGDGEVEDYALTIDPDLPELCSHTDTANYPGYGNNLPNTTYSLLGTDVTYNRGGSSNEVVGYNAAGQGPALRLLANDTTDLIFSNPVYSVSFKITDFDEREIVTVIVYDENGVAYNLGTTGVASVGSNVQQTGNVFDQYFTTSNVDGDNPATDGTGSVVFFFPTRVSHINISTNQPSGTLRWTQINYCYKGSIDDYSDAPADGSIAPDGTSITAYGDATHTIVTNLQLGTTVDPESSSIASATANGDGADDDGISTLGILTNTSQTYSIDTLVTNQIGSTARLIAWIDFDGNGTFDPNEAAIRSIPTGTVNSPITLNWSNIPTDIQAGNTFLRLRLTTDSMTNSEPTIAKNNGEVEDYPIAIINAGVAINGRVYIDTNSNAIADSGESGIGNTVVILRNIVTGICRSTSTNSNGNYRFINVTDSNYEIYQAHGETTPVPQNCGTSNANNPTGYQSTTPDTLTVSVSGSDVTNKDFGEVPGANSSVSGNTGMGIRFEPNHQSAVLPGNVVFYPHAFTSDADGNVSFISNGSNNNTAGWSQQIYRDTNCNDVLDGAEGNTPIAGMSFGITASSKVCLINKIYAPANVSAQDRYDVKTTATFNYAGSSLAPVLLDVTDVTTVGQTVTPIQNRASRLELNKTVENLTQGTGETQALNQAKPGDHLMYRVYYRNTGTGPITDLKINDMVPNHTGIVNGSATCDTTPIGVTCTPTLNSTELVWGLTGIITGGSLGHVSYEVIINN